MIEWHDCWRLANVLVCLVSIFILGRRYAKNSWSWNAKTKDYWYAFVMANVAFIASQLTGFVRDTPMTVVPVFITAASLAMFRGLLRNGSWGENTAEKN